VSSQTSFLSLLTCLCLVAACKTSHVGVTNHFGSYEAVVAAPADRAIGAAEEVVHELRLRLVSSQSTAVDGRVEALTANDRKVVIQTETAGASVSRLSVRVGNGFGDESLSLDIIERIRAKL